jgi:FtsP/CotA-like multicopper oxidase with cupredoxin domain
MYRSKWAAPDNGGRPRGSPATRALLGASAVLIALVGSIASVAQVTEPAPQVCDDPTRSISLFAEQLGPRRYGYGLTPGTASIPGPTIEMFEGECLAVTLVNDTDRRLSMHAHGVDYTVASDGTPLNKGCVRPGRARTFVFQAHPPAARPDESLEAGSAGYWHYHDHCMGGDHGTEGIRKGLFGAFVVRRPGDSEPDVPPFVVMMGPGMTIGLRKAPDTPVFEAAEGQRVEFVVIAHGDLFHTFHLHGHRWVDNRTGIPVGPDDPAQLIDNRTIGPADSFGFQVIAGEGVGPGAWMYHCHVQGHSDAGMTGLFVVTTPDGTLTQAAREALDRWPDASHQM